MTVVDLPVGTQVSNRLDLEHIRCSDEDFRYFGALASRLAGIALPPNKRELVQRRLVRRVHLLGLADFSAYRAYLDGPEGTAEVQNFIDALTTNLTRFFREEHHFMLLDERIGDWLQDGIERLRVWSAGCSTGEEAYSIAMTVSHALAQAPAIDCRILATDIDSRVLEEAAKGIFSREAVAALPRFARGMVQGADPVEVAASVRRLVSFRRHNLAGEIWPMTGPFDVIFCRNVLIYFPRATQERIIRRLVGYLRPGGLLCLGHSETAPAGVADLVRAEAPSSYVVRRR